MQINQIHNVKLNENDSFVKINKRDSIQPILYTNMWKSTKFMNLGMEEETLL